MQSKPDPTTGFTSGLELSSGEYDPTIDAGFYEPSSIGDFVWEDINANGLQEAGEPGIPNVGVELLASINGGTTVLTSTVTDANGLYLFDGLPLGIYRVRFAEIPGWRVTLKFQGVSGDNDSDPDPDTRTTDDITIAVPIDRLDIDAGYYEPAEIGDYTWTDTNGNGIQDTGEPPLPGVTVVLEHPDGTPVVIDPISAAATVVTAADGSYHFTGLTPGDYQVRFTAPAPFSTTLQHVGDPALDSDPDRVTGITQIVTVISGEANETIDAGYFRTAELGSYVWMDINIDGIRDDGEPPVQDVTVNLYREGDSAVLRTTTTDIDGYFLFTDLAPGRYRLRFDAPTGLAFTWRDATTDPMANSDVNPVTGETDFFSLLDNQVDLTWGAGLIIPTNDPEAPEPDGGWDHRQWLPAIQGQP